MSADHLIRYDRGRRRRFRGPGAGNARSAREATDLKESAASVTGAVTRKQVKNAKQSDQSHAESGIRPSERRHARVDADWSAQMIEHFGGRHALSLQPR